MNSKQLLQKQRELTKLTDRIRAQGNSLATERSYRLAVGKYIDFLCGQEWPDNATSRDKVESYLTSEARRDVASSTQNGSLHAILYYYQQVRKETLENIDALRSKRGEQVRQAPSVDDTRKVLMAVADSGGYPTRLICHLIYGCGLRVGETVSIRLKDLDLAAGKLTIVGGKGKKDRFINLPPSLIPHLRQQSQSSEALQKKAAAMGVPTKLPHRYGNKNPRAAFQRRWFWLFPQLQPCHDPRSRARVWWHCLESTVQRAMRRANRHAGTEGISPHLLRHAWATHSADAGASLPDLQEILGHRDIRTTMRYVRPSPERVPSPLETLKLAA